MDDRGVWKIVWESEESVGNGRKCGKQDSSREILPAIKRHIGQENVRKDQK
eukprot:GAHX01003864.1.p2 GENE.GAHX01003864.1~~GAHX01003864.1.p2  ORF type:complete len:51 (-),score=2.94 GAHX01003864.1:84-236(-)